MTEQRSDGHPGIGFFPFVPGCDFSQKNTDERRKKDRSGKQKDGIWKPVQNNREHRHAVMKRNSEISGKEVFEIVDILQPDRLIEPQLGN